VAYYTLIRSSLEYACQAWDPYKKKYIKTIEKEINKALRFIFGIRGIVSFGEI
jgi:uncharacterized iron-regulated protein